MRLCVISEHAQGGAYVLGDAVRVALEKCGHEVSLYSIQAGVPHPKDMREFDHVHFISLRAMHPFRDKIAVPTSATIHHMSLGTERYYTSLLEYLVPDTIHVTDHFTQRDLGRRGFCNVCVVPQAIPRRFALLAGYPAEFTLGYIGGDPKYKRFAAIEEMAARAHVKCIGHVTDTDNWLSEDELESFYQSINLYVVASFEDGGPVPAQEAMQYGIPVISTYVGSMPKYPVVLYDGSVSGGVEAIKFVQRHYEVRRSMVAGINWDDRVLEFGKGLQAMIERTHTLERVR